MNITLDEAKATLIRLQGQMDVWQNIYMKIEAEEKAKNDLAAQG